jgi:hypothetical protein
VASAERVFTAPDRYDASPERIPGVRAPSSARSIQGFLGEVDAFCKAYAIEFTGQIYGEPVTRVFPKEVAKFSGSQVSDTQAEMEPGTPDEPLGGPAAVGN